MNNDNPYAAQFMASINNPQPVPSTPAAKASPLKIIMIVSLLLVVILSVVLIISISSSRNKTPEVVHTGASVMLVPLNATAEINGKKYNNGTYFFNPGKYKAHITADGFGEKDVEFEVTEAKLTTVAVYLRPQGGSYSDEDLDLLRFLSDDDETNALIENRLLENQNIKFASYEKGLLSIDKVPLSDDYVGTSKKIVAETVSAYFYYAHPEITKFASIVGSNDGKSFEIVVDDTQRYTVNYIAYRDETSSRSAYNITYVSLQKWGSDDEVFWYDGSFSYGGIVRPTIYETEDSSFD